jgi:hypothetical protein
VTASLERSARLRRCLRQVSLASDQLGFALSHHNHADTRAAAGRIHQLVDELALVFPEHPSGAEIVHVSTHLAHAIHADDRNDIERARARFDRELALLKLRLRVLPGSDARAVPRSRRGLEA